MGCASYGLFTRATQTAEGIHSDSRSMEVDGMARCLARSTMKKSKTEKS